MIETSSLNNESVVQNVSMSIDYKNTENIGTAKKDKKQHGNTTRRTKSISSNATQNTEKRTKRKSKNGMKETKRNTIKHGENGIKGTKRKSDYITYDIIKCTLHTITT